MRRFLSPLVVADGIYTPPTPTPDVEVKSLLAIPAGPLFRKASFLMSKTNKGGRFVLRDRGEGDRASGLSQRRILPI